MKEFSQISFNSQNKSKVMNTSTPKDVENVQQLVGVPRTNINSQISQDTISFKANEHVQNPHKGLSTGVKWAIGIGVVTTTLAIGLDLLFCKGKHIKKISGKLKRNHSKQNNSLQSSSIPDNVKITSIIEDGKKITLETHSDKYATTKIFKDTNGKTIKKKVYRHGTDFSEKDSVEYFYDTNGKETKVIFRDKNESVTAIEEISYDNKGRKKEIIDKNKKNEICGRRVFGYDKKGRIEQSVYFDLKDESTRYISYNTKGKFKRQTHRNKNGEIISDRNYLYDSKGRLLKETHTDSKGKIVLECENTYTADGKITTETHYKTDQKIIHTYYSDAKDELTKTIKTTCDADNNVISEVTKIYKNGKVFIKKNPNFNTNN